MSVSPELLLMALSALFGAVAAWFFCEPRVRSLKAQLDDAEAGMRAQAASHAQVMHTTKLAALGQMVAGVAHEINTPLGFVKSNVEVVNDLLGEYEPLAQNLVQGVDATLAARPVLPAPVREALVRARDSLAQHSGLRDARELLSDSVEGIASISNLVSNLKGFARVDRDGMDQVDINEALRSALIVAAHQLRDRVRVVTDFGELPKVQCMPSQVNQVFLNLITNAAQAMPEERGTLTVRTRALDGAVEIAVTDTGSGIPDEVLPKIFDPFFTTKAVGEGTGLGLSIVHKIIKAHGGSIHVRTALGKGTTFTITLPVELRSNNVTPLARGRAA
jgi:signal transduction histidine kinase